MTLDVLLRERNVTRVPERLGSSQPAVSAALSAGTSATTCSTGSATGTS
jgi:hypothetical protein